MKLALKNDALAVKICGITNREDALAAIEAGAGLLGFNTWTGSKRFVDLAQNGGWIAELPPVVRVALLVNAGLEEAKRIAALPFIDALQLHGDEDEACCRAAAEFGKPIIKAIRARDRGAFANAGGFSTSHILLDAHVTGEFGGTGTRVDLELVRQFKREHPALILWLAGGLTAANVAEAVRAVRPAVVDVSSGVELQPGKKSPEQMRSFVTAAVSA